MNMKLAVAGLVFLFSASAISTDAHAYVKCDAEEDEAKKAKCEGKEAKRIAKLRSKTTPFKPSALSAAYAGMDADDKNIFNMDDWYVPTYETGVKDVDTLLGSVSRIDAALTMAAYIGKLNKDGKADEAKALAKDLLPELKKMKDDVKAITDSINKIKADPKSVVASNPAALPKVLGALGTATTTLPALVAEIPKALGAIGPIAGGAAGAAVEGAVDKAKDAAGK